ncbi:MAG: flavin monoamine oxidase family protein, partial [Trinickia sp.]
AGLAGIAAAYTLLDDHRVDKVHLFEASGRYGGRARTDKTSIPGFAFDMGAQYIQDPSINPLTAIANELEFETIEEDALYELRVEDDGQWVDLPTTTPEVQDVVDDIQESYDKAAQYPNAVVARKPRVDKEQELLGHATSPYGPFTESAETWQYIAADRAREAHGDGKNNLFVKEGIGALVSKYGRNLSARYESRYVERMNARVMKITRDEQRVTVRTSDRSETFDACIVTVPVSILANDSLAFHPPLPESHRQALNVLRLGSYKKLALRLRTSAPEIVPGTNYYLVNDDPRGVWQYYRLPFYPDVLVAHTSGEFARQLDQFEDSEVFTLFKDAIKRAYDDGIRFTTGKAITNWSIDTAALGAYSYSAFVGGGRDDPDALHARVALAEPVGRVHFAGEATNLDYYGTLQGAYFEGCRAAAEVLSDAR